MTRKMKPRVFHYLCDPGHGWLCVSIADSEALGLLGSDYSPYSYRKGNRYYLEEDCDMPKFLRAYVRQYGHDPIIRDSHTDRRHWVRDCAMIS